MDVLEKIPQPSIEGVKLYRMTQTNFQPHPFVAGAKTMGGEMVHMITDASLCSAPGCNLSYKEHTYDKVLLLRISGENDTEGLNNIPGLKEYLGSLKEVMEKLKITGVGFVREKDIPKPKVWENYSKPSGCTFGDPGNACYLEPPGHPRYFVRHIFNRYGNSKSSPPHYYLNGRGYEHLEQVDELFKPLPLEHPRVQAWITAVFIHLHDCYYDENGEKSEDETLVFPVPSYKLKHFHDDLRFSDEWRDKEIASVNQANAEIVKRAAAIATVDNHRAVRLIRKYYPDFKPTDSLIHGKLIQPGDWWERMETRPTPEKCPGLYDIKHPSGKNWCQMCGWHAEETPKEPKP